MVWYKRDAERLIVTLYIQPGAKSTEISGLHDDALKIRLNTPPIEGRANKALLTYIAKLFAVPIRQVVLKQGAKSRRKVLIITDTTVDPESLLPKTPY